MKRNNTSIKTDMALVSIVVPVYNSGGYLERCLDSLITQSYKNIEFILIDDGSTDDSRVIMSNYANADGRVKVIHQENSGVSFARNEGVRISSGEYIAFVDADDWLEESAIEASLGLIKMHNVDVVRTTANVIRKKSTHVLTTSVQEGLYRGSDEIDRLIWAAAKGDLLCYSWLLLIKRDTFKGSELDFPVGISMMEDAWFYVNLLRRVRAVYISNRVTYNYEINEQSATQSMSGLKGKIDSVVALNSYLESLSIFSQAQIGHINAVHVSNVISLIMVRADKARSLRDLFKLVSTASRSAGLKRMYSKADFKGATLYNRMASWAVVEDNRLIIGLLMVVRKIYGK